MTLFSLLVVVSVALVMSQLVAEQHAALMAVYDGLGGLTAKHFFFCPFFVDRGGQAARTRRALALRRINHVLATTSPVEAPTSLHCAFPVLFCLAGLTVLRIIGKVPLTGTIPDAVGQLTALTRL